MQQLTTPDVSIPGVSIPDVHMTGMRGVTNMRVHVQELRFGFSPQQQHHFMQQQHLLQCQLRHSLTAAAHFQAAQQVLTRRLATFLLQIDVWLESFTVRCNEQSLQLPVECASSLHLLQSIIPMLSPGGGIGFVPLPACTYRCDILSATAAVPTKEMPAIKRRKPCQTATAGTAVPSSSVEMLAQVPSSSGAPSTNANLSAAIRASIFCSSKEHHAATEEMPFAAGHAAAATLSTDGDPALHTLGGLGSAGVSGFAGVPALHSTAANLALSPSAFCSLLNSPDLQQLMSPQVTISGINSSISPLSAELAPVAHASSSMFKRRQGREQGGKLTTTEMAV